MGRKNSSKRQPANAGLGQVRQAGSTAPSGGWSMTGGGGTSSIAQISEALLQYQVSFVTFLFILYRGMMMVILWTRVVSVTAILSSIVWLAVMISQPNTPILCISATWESSKRLLSNS